MPVKVKLIKACGIFIAAALLAGCSSMAGSQDSNKSNSGNDSVQDAVNGNFFEEQESGMEAKLPAKMPSFTAKDLDGNTITDDIFKEKDLTVLNIWGTFCTPCVEEMPELGEWAKEIPGNVQIIGLVCDIDGEEDETHKELARTIVEKAGADFTQIIANNDLSSILNWVTGVPTTLFIDKDGNITGEPVIGADVSGYKEFVEAYFNGN